MQRLRFSGTITVTHDSIAYGESGYGEGVYGGGTNPPTRTSEATVSFDVTGEFTVSTDE